MPDEEVQIEDDVAKQLEQSDLEDAIARAGKRAPKLNLANIQKISQGTKATDLASAPEATPSATVPKLNFDNLKKISDGISAKVPNSALTPSISDASLDNNASKELSSMEYLGRSFGAGLSFEIAPNQLQTDKNWLKYSGYASHVVGSLLGGYLAVQTVGAASSAIGLSAATARVGLSATAAAKAAKEAQLAYKVGKVALSAGEATATEVAALAKGAATARNINLALQTGKAVGESAIIGGGVGAAEGLKYGNDFEDVILSAGKRAKEYAEFGAILTPVVGAASSMIGGRGLNKYASAVQEQLTEGSPLKEAINKVRLIDPKLSAVDLLTKPGKLKELHGQNLKSSAEGLFINEGAPFKDLVLTNPDLKALLDRQMYGKAIDALGSKTLETLKKDSSLAELVAFPFLNNAESIAQSKTLALLGKKKFLAQRNNEQIFNLVNDYFQEPTANKLQNFKQMGKEGVVPKQFGRTLQTFDKKDLSSIYLNKSRQFELVNNRIKTQLDYIAGRPVSVSQVGSLNDSDAVIDGLITLNRPLLRDTIESFASQFSPENNYGVVEPELIAPVKAMAKKQLLSQEVGSYFNRLTAIREAIGSGEFKGQESVLMQERSALLRKVSTRNRDINALGQEISAQNPETLKKATAYFQDLYLPSNEAQRAAGNSKKMYQRIFYKDNPVYLKNTGELSEQLHAMNVLKQDLPRGWNYFSYNNIQRKIGNILGLNNPIQKYVFDVYKKLNVERDLDHQKYQKTIDQLGIKPGSELSALVQKFGEGHIDEASPEMLKLKLGNKDSVVGERAKVINAANALKGMYKELLGKVNEVNAKFNLPLVNERQDYFHHFQDISNELGDVIQTKLLGTKFEKERFRMYDETPFKPLNAKTTMIAERARKGGEYTEDAIEGITRYLSPVMDRIHYQELVRQLDNSAMFAPSGVGKMLKTFKEETLLGIRPEDKTSPIIKKTLDIYRGLAAKSLILGNIKSLYNQVTSTALSGFWGSKEAVAATFKLPFMKETLKKSTNLALREAASEGYSTDAKELQAIFQKVSNAKIIGKPVQKLGEAREFLNEFSRKAFDVFDKVAASHTFTTSYMKGAKAGLTEDQAVRFADWATGLTHGEMTKIGSPEFMGNVFARSLLQFQSFTMNLFATLVNDMPRMAARDGTGKAVTNLMKTYAIMSIANDVASSASMPEPFNIETFIPGMSTAKFGVSGPLGVVASGMGALAGSDASKKDLKRDADNLKWALTGTAGTAQVRRTSKELGRDDTKEIDSGFDRMMIYVFGQGARDARAKHQNKKENFRSNLRGY